MTVRKTGNFNAAERISQSGDLVMVTPTDSVEFEFFTRGIIMSTGNDGTLAGVDVQGKTVTIPIGTLITGVLYPFELKSINGTNTTATAVLCLF